MMSTLFERLPVAARWLIIVGIAYTLADTVRFVLASPTPVSAEAAGVTPRDAGPGISADATLRRIQARNLFGAADPVVEATPPQAAAPRETALALQLRGVFVSDSPESSVAIVAMPNQRGQLYAVGDMLPGDVELVAVEGDGVVIRNGGVEEMLRFPVTQAGQARMGVGVLGPDEMNILMEMTEVRPPDPHVDDHPDRWKPGFSKVLGMVPEDAEGDDG